MVVELQSGAVRCGVPDAREIVVDRSRARAGAGQDQAGDASRVAHSIGLRQDAAEGMAQHHPVLQAQMSPELLQVSHHVLEGITPSIRESLRAARAPLVDEHEAILSSQGLQIRQEIRVVGTRTAMQEQ